MDLTQLSQQDLLALKAQLDALAPDTSGRSPMRFGKDRQLHDLRLAPTADDPRPMFVWSAEPPRNAPLTPPPYARLMWHKVSNHEITVHSPSEFARREAEGEFTGTPPQMGPIDPQQELAELLAQLSPEDRQLLEEQMRKSKMTEIESRLSSLSSAAHADVFDRVDAIVGPKATKKKAG